MAQISDSTEKLPLDVDFLFHYYEQDGNHSPVTGGIGTEELRDRSFKVIVHAPLDSSQSLDVDAAINYYTSASTDRIDPYLSSASYKDIRTRGHIAYSRVLNDKFSYNLGIGGSIESDYISSSLRLGAIFNTPDNNRQIALSAQAYWDSWVVILPDELRAPGMVSIPTDKRRTYNFHVQYSQVINPRLQLSFSLETVYQNGLLSTPFHRVFFSPDSLPTVEKFPSYRWKLPLSLRLHYFLGDQIVFRGFYRYYWDSFGIRSHTGSLEIPVKIGPFFSIYPFYRYHTQSGARYFRAFAEHESGSRFYTSDFDLSGLHSHRIGLGINWSPLYGLARLRLKRIAVFKTIALRFSYYQRSDGLEAYVLGLNMSWQLQ